MRIKRVLFSSLMALALVCVCLLVLPTEAQAASKSDLTFALSTDREGYTVVDCNSIASGDLEIPASYNGKPVIAIGDWAFSGCDDLTNITIPNSVTSIGERVFDTCSNLIGIWVDEENQYFSSDAYGVLFNKEKSILIATPGAIASYTVPNSVTAIGEWTFCDCDHLNSIIIGDNVALIGDRAFSYCGNLTSITIPNSVTSIGEYTFAYCNNLTNVVIGNSVSLIDDWSFSGCSSLKSFFVNEENQHFSSDAQGVLFNKDKTILVAAPGTITSYTIPNNVISIGNCAFSSCRGLTNFIIPDSVNFIGNHAFQFCDNLTNITIGNSVTSIGWCAFGNCNSLTNIAIPDSVTSIGDNAFHYCSNLTNVTIGNSVTSIGKQAFQYCINLTNITIKDNVTSIGDWAFQFCSNLTNVTIGDSVTSIGNRAFYNCKNLSNVYYKGSLAEWNQIAIGGNNDSLTNATIHYKPETPTDFKVSLADYNDVKLSWKAADGANRYYVYYRRAGKSEWKRAGITTSKSYTVKDLVAGGTYEFKVISYYKDNGGTIKGNATKVLTCSTARNLKAPSKVTVKLYGYDDVKISWSKVTYAKGYKVYYKRSTAKSYSYVGFTTGTYIKKANLSDGMKYTFKVVPCTKVNGSYFADDSSKTASITTLKTVSTPKVAKYTSSKVKVSWTDISGESGYQVVVASDKAGKKKVTTTTATGKSKVVTAKKGVTYYYKVRAYKTVDGKKIYAPWSKVKAYKLK